MNIFVEMLNIQYHPVELFDKLIQMKGIDKLIRPRETENLRKDS